METTRISTTEALLARARSALGRGIRYRLGAGGMDPRSESPADANNECDCSGFVCWALGISRQTDHPLYVGFNGGWINTDAMVHDAGSPTGFFTRLAEPRVGSIIVYGAKPPSRRVGHVGIVTALEHGGGVERVASVLHCSHGNHARTAEALGETDASAFRRTGTIYAWYEGIG